MKNEVDGFPMRSKSKARAFFLSLTWLLSISVSSCSLFGLLPQGTTTTTLQFSLYRQGSGSRILGCGNFIYRVGGLDEAGAPSAAVRMASPETADANGAWQDTAFLPKGISHGSVFRAGNLVYVLGGVDDASSISSSIYYTLINSDGTLGFGADKRWESNSPSLPEGRANAAWILHDGWIFLIGGETASGATDSIIRARLYQDGQVGQWYASKATLPDARWGSSAIVIGDRLYVVGGANTKAVKFDVISFTLGEYGSLSDRRNESSLPAALQNPVLLADGEDLVPLGGYGAQEGSEEVYWYAGGQWTDIGLSVKAEGPSCVRVGKDIYFLKQAGGIDGELGKLSGLFQAPEPPVVIPGSGLVPTSSPIRVTAGTGLKVRYRTDGLAPGIADPEYPATPIKISSAALPSMKLSLAAFSSDGVSSPVVYREYRVRSGSLFVTIEGTLAVHDATASDLESHVMEEHGSAGTEPTPASSLWYRMTISTAGSYRLAWADSDEDPAFSARIKVSLYEKDLYTEIPDADEGPIYDRRNGTASPLSFSLNPGEYYIGIKEVDGVSTGRTFAILLKRDGR